MKKFGEQGRGLAKAELGIWMGMVSPDWTCGRGATMKSVSRSELC